MQTSWAAGSMSTAARRRWGSPFCRVIRPTKTTSGRAGSMPWRTRAASPRSGRYWVASMPLWMMWTRWGSMPAIAAEHVPAHRLGDGDHRIGGEQAGALAEEGEGVATTELLGLPGSERLQAVGGADVGHAPDQLGQVSRQVRVPGVRMDEVDPVQTVRHGQVHRHHRQRRVLRAPSLEGLPGPVGGGDQRRAARLAEAVHRHRRRGGPAPGSGARRGRRHRRTPPGGTRG